METTILLSMDNAATTKHLLQTSDGKGQNRKAPKHMGYK